MNKTNPVLRHAILAALAGTMALPVWAQEQSNLVEEIVVTARKREETLQDVPFSVAAQTEETLRVRGASSLEDVSRNVAGFTVQDLGPGQSQVAIRGVSAGQIVRDQPGVKEQVGVYLDESVISLSLFTPDLDLFDLNRVEVLRGPQGTLFGSGSLSGTVRYITNQPVIGESESYGEFSAVSIDDGDTGGYAKAVVNVPISDTTALRAVGYYRNDPGFIDAIGPNGRREDVNDADVAGVRIALRSEPSDRLTLTPRLVYQDIESNGFARFDNYNILGNPFTTSRPAIRLDEREQYTQFDEVFTDEFLLADLTVEYEMNNDMVFTSVTSWTDRDILMVRDATQLTASITGGSIGLGPEVYTIDSPLDDATEVSTFTQELRLSGGTEDLQWVAGLFYSDIEREYGQSLLVPGFEALTGIPTMGSFGAATDVLFFSDLTYDFKQIALFGEATWAATERLDVTAGLRYYDFDEDRIQTFDGIFAAPGTMPGSTSSDGISPRLMLNYAFSDTTDINAQISKGFRLGGINDPLNVPLCTAEDLATFGGNDAWEDEELWNYEIGLKSRIMDGRGTFNAALFFMDIDDLQATVTAGSCSSRVIFNVPEAESTGLELEWAAQLTDQFDLAVTASFIDSEFKSTLTSTDSSGNVSVLAGIQSGNALPTVPEKQIAAAATYNWDIGSGWEGFTTGVYQYVDERITQSADINLGSINLLQYGEVGIGGPFTQDTFTFDPILPDYSIVNWRIGARNDQWEVSFFINNLTDEVAYLALDQERGTAARQGYLINKPRSYGVTARFAF